MLLFFYREPLSSRPLVYGTTISRALLIACDQWKTEDRQCKKGTCTAVRHVWTIFTRSPRKRKQHHRVTSRHVWSLARVLRCSCGLPKTSTLTFLAWVSFCEFSMRIEPRAAVQGRMKISEMCVVVVVETYDKKSILKHSLALGNEAFSCGRECFTVPSAQNVVDFSESLCRIALWLMVSSVRIVVRTR